jgi:phosphoglycerol transferase MdoB-like AlkP superfamily enzyme
MMIVTAVACLVALALSRIGLVAWQYGRVAAAGDPRLEFIFLQGLRFDVVTLGLLLGPPAILSPLLASSRRLASGWLRFLRVYCLLVIAVVVFMEAATPSFINEFDVKPDRRFVEYLVYPKEVFGMLTSAYGLQLLLATGLVTGSVCFLNRSLGSHAPPASRLPLWQAALLVPVIAVVAVAAVRSTLDHRPVNPSTVVFSTDPLANQLPLNSTYTVLYALYEMTDEGETFPYRSVSLTASVAAVRKEMRIPETDFTGGPDSTLHRQAATEPRERPINLVIVLEESLGAEFVGSMGGLPLTPELDRLRDDGIWFENLYATGTRSVRGIEAVVSGFPPTAARSVVKLPRAQQDFFTIAGLLGSMGYATSFIYAGEPQFDNMARFLANNGFQTIVGKHDFTGEVFEGDWGVSDEDLFRRADQFFREQSDGRPFFSLLFTASNHSPWDYPEGRIEPYNSPAATRENAVKYADHALGDFIRTAREGPYWDNTIFLVIADHCSRTYGAELVPVGHFRIPGLILGGTIQPRRIDRVASQIDMLPTLLSLAGISSEHPAIGIDQSRHDLEEFAGRAVMQYGSSQAYMEGERVAILQKGLPARQFVYRDGALTPATDEPDFLAGAEALANWPWLAYLNHTYR